MYSAQLDLHGDFKTAIFEKKPFLPQGTEMSWFYIWHILRLFFHLALCHTRPVCMSMYTTVAFDNLLIKEKSINQSIDRSIDKSTNQ